MLSPRHSDLSQEEKDRAPELNVVHVTSRHFCNVLIYKTHRLINNSQPYNNKMAARSDNYSKHMEMLMQAYKYDDKDPITVLRLLA